ncbi:proline-rich protein PRCC-like [Ptychodera flava]|uniref:proline-rich protein PRCC-like n=1 Tax=Ptychodera flava TaxID=63121 RepID=UPI00396A27B1
MSLVNYGSSDESDSEEENMHMPKSTASSSGDSFSSTTARKQTPLPVSSARSLLSSLPPPKSASVDTDVVTIGYGKGTKTMSESTNTETSVKQGGQPSSTTDRPMRSLNLPPPKKGQPVKITVPSLPDPDSDEDEPAPKKARPSSQGSGLFALLPQPKHAIAKENNRILIPHTLTKKPSVQKPQVKTPATSTKPQTSKPAVRTSGMAGFLNYGSDEDDEPSSFFSLDEKDTQKLNTERQVQNVKSENVSSTVNQTLNTKISSGQDTPLAFKNSQSNLHQNNSISMQQAAKIPPVSDHLASSSATSTMPMNRADAPLDFSRSSNAVSSSSHGYGASGNSYGYSQQYQHSYQDYNQPYQEPYQQYTVTEDQSSGYLGNNQEQYQAAESTSHDDYINDEGFKRLQGKKRQGEAIQIIDIQEDRQDYTSTEWVSKHQTEEKEYRAKLRKEQLPTSQQRKKHQITYLAHQAKERELELKNSWAENRLTRKQTQAKYGF